MSNLVDKMKPLQLLYNLDKAGIDMDNIVNSSYSKIESEPIENWANRILDENKHLLDICSREEFIKNIIYGKQYKIL